MLQSDVATAAGISPAEVDQQAVELLPQRAALGGLVNVVTIVPVNIAIAVNAATFGSTATAHAMQGIGYFH
jgi:hypothetical protein